jgi:hypothetical protein
MYYLWIYVFVSGCDLVSCAIVFVYMYITHRIYTLEVRLGYYIIFTLIHSLSQLD